MSVELHNSLVFSIYQSFSNTLPFWFHNSLQEFWLYKMYNLSDNERYSVYIDSKTNPPRYPLSTERRSKTTTFKKLTKLISVVFIQDCIPCSFALFFYIYSAYGIFLLLFVFKHFIEEILSTNSNSLPRCNFKFWTRAFYTCVDESTHYNFLSLICLKIFLILFKNYSVVINLNLRSYHS